MSVGGEAPRVSSSTRSPRSARGIAARRVRAAQKPLHRTAPTHCRLRARNRLHYSSNMPFQILSTLREGTGAPGSATSWSSTTRARRRRRRGLRRQPRARPRVHVRARLQQGDSRMGRGARRRDEGRALHGAHPERRRVRAEGRAAADPAERRPGLDLELLNINETLVEEGMRFRQEEARVQKFLAVQDEERRAEAAGGGGGGRKAAAEPQRRRRQRLRLRLVVEQRELGARRRRKEKKRKKKERKKERRKERRRRRRSPRRARRSATRARARASLAVRVVSLAR